MLFYHVCIKYEQGKGKSLSHVQLFATPWTAAYQAPLSVGLSRQEYWSGVPSPSPKYEQSYPKLIPCAFGGNEGLGYKSCSELLTKPDNRIILHPIIFSALGPVQFCLETWLQMNLWDHFVLSGWSQKRNDPQNFYALILLNCGYVTWHGIKDFADVMKLRMLRWEDYLALPRWVQCHHKHLYKRKARRLRIGGDVQIKAKQESWRYYDTAFEDEGRGHEPKSVGNF